MFSIHTYLLKSNSVIGSELNIDHVHKGVILENVEHSFVDIRDKLEVKKYFTSDKNFFGKLLSLSSTMLLFLISPITT